MSRAMKLAQHLSSEELRIRYHECKDVNEKEHWHMLWRVSVGENAVSLGRFFDCSPQTIHKLVRRYNTSGPSAVADRRRQNPGVPTALSLDDQKALDLAISQRHPDGGLWTGPKVKVWIEERLGRTVGDNLGWRYLKRLDYTPQSPRPRSHKASEESQAAFKK